MEGLEIHPTCFLLLSLNKFCIARICVHQVCSEMQVAAAETLQRASLGSRRDKIGCVFVFPLCIRFWPRSQVLGRKDHQDQASRWHGWELDVEIVLQWQCFFDSFTLLKPFCTAECCSPLGPFHSKVRVERTDSYGRTTSSFEGQL